MDMWSGSCDGGIQARHQRFQTCSLRVRSSYCHLGDNSAPVDGVGTSHDGRD